MHHIGGGQYEQTFDPEGPQADCWVFEDLVYIHKRHVAAVGFDRDDMTMSPITYDEMRPGCYEPKARVEDMQMNHVEASLCFPSFPRFCGQTFTEARDRWPSSRTGRSIRRARPCCPGHLVDDSVEGLSSGSCWLPRATPRRRQARRGCPARSGCR